MCAFNVYYKIIENPKLPTKSAPWLCDYCKKKKDKYVQIFIDYDTVVLCTDCLKEFMERIKEKEDDD